MRPVPVVFLLFAFMPQLSVLHMSVRGLVSAAEGEKGFWVSIALVDDVLEAGGEAGQHTLTDLSSRIST